MPKSIAGKRVGTDSVRGWIDNRGGGNTVHHNKKSPKRDMLLKFFSEHTEEWVRAIDIARAMGRGKNDGVESALCDLEVVDVPFVIVYDEDAKRYMAVPKGRL